MSISFICNYSNSFCGSKKRYYSWHIEGGVHDEEQQLKTKFGAELTQEVCCPVSKVVCVETNKVFFFLNQRRKKIILSSNAIV